MARLRLRKYFDRSFRDNTETAFTTDQKRIQLQSRRMLRHRPGTQNFPVRQDRFQAEHLLAHGAIDAGAIADTVSGYGAADGGHRHRPRVMAENKVEGVKPLVE